MDYQIKEIKLKDGVTEEEAQKRMEILLLNDLLRTGAIEKEIYDKALDRINNGKKKELLSFEELSSEERESSLMFSAMRCYEVFLDLFGKDIEHCKLNIERLWETDSIEQLRIFSEWAKDFETEYHGSEEYSFDYIGLTDRYFKEQIAYKWGSDELLGEIQ